MGVPRRVIAHRIHPTADVSPQALIGEGTRIWHEAQVREGARVGRNCILGKGVYIDFEVVLGDRCKLQNGAYVYHGATLEDGVFIGPRAMLLNDRNPRAVNPEDVADDDHSSVYTGKPVNVVAGSLKTTAEWQVSRICVGEGASIGGGAIVLPGVIIGRWAMVGAGAVVTFDVPDYGLVYGNPARLCGFVCPCGRQLMTEGGHSATTNVMREDEENRPLVCDACGRQVFIEHGFAHITESPRPPGHPADIKS